MQLLDSMLKHPDCNFLVEDLDKMIDPQIFPEYQLLYYPRYFRNPLLKIHLRLIIPKKWHVGKVIIFTVKSGIPGFYEYFRVEVEDNEYIKMSLIKEVLGIDDSQIEKFPF